MISTAIATLLICAGALSLYQTRERLDRPADPFGNAVFTYTGFGMIGLGLLIVLIKVVT